MRKIQALGAGCSKWHKLTEITRVIADRLGAPCELEHVTEVMRFADLGVMSVAAPVVDGKVVVVGRVPGADAITARIE